MTPVESTQLRQRRGFVLTLSLLIATSAITIDVSLPSVPGVAAAMNTSIGQSQLIIGLFMVGMAVGQIPAGLLSDRFGRLPVLFGGMSLFTVCGIVAAAAPSIEVLLAARLVQGLASSTAVVLSRAIVRDVASGQDAARLMSLMTMIFTAAPVLAPSLGALLINAFDWRAPFVFIAAGSLLVLLAIRRHIPETHTPNPRGNPLGQLQASFVEFFGHRQSVFALAIMALAPAGFMSIIAISSALATEIYGYSLTRFGIVFAFAGLSILAGSFTSRLLVSRADAFAMIRFASLIIAVAGIQLAVIAWLNDASFIWIWGSVCLYMFAMGILLPNATVIALDPLPRIAGVASSIIGTTTATAGAAGALAGALLYNGSVRNAVLVLALVCGFIVTVYLLRPLFCERPTIQHAEPLARD